MKRIMKTTATLTGGFFMPKNKDLIMPSLKEKAPIPCRVTELGNTHTAYCNSLIIQGKHLYSIAQKACSAILINDLYIAIAPLLIIAMSLLTAYAMGGL